MKIDILTIFPEMFKVPLSESIIGKARESGLIEINIYNIRDFTVDKHRMTDDYPFGGGAGMIMKPEPIFAATEYIQKKMGEPADRVILMTPQGKTLNQGMVKALAEEHHIIIICARYEGVDERLRDALVTDEISIGDYVLTGGELPAMVLVDAVTRFVPGVLSRDTLVNESFEKGVLDYPQYTRPRDFRGMIVPDVLISGNHEKIRLWRKKQALTRTLSRRPDLLEKASLDPEDYKLLRDIKSEQLSDLMREDPENEYD
ncbi:MAG: tRNA (guanosine(37)-N1)-methyltransferase TrmD [Firmicutes bacterium]|nr:tRNA (guanosine(37)-N1)-methyltransferase TrmD [Bacillota bacterium]